MYSYPTLPIQSHIHAYKHVFFIQSSDISYLVIIINMLNDNELVRSIDFVTRMISLSIIVLCHLQVSW